MCPSICSCCRLRTASAALQYCTVSCFMTSLNMEATGQAAGTPPYPPGQLIRFKKSSHFANFWRQTLAWFIVSLCSYAMADTRYRVMVIICTAILILRFTYQVEVNLIFIWVIPRSKLGRDSHYSEYIRGLSRSLLPLKLDHDRFLPHKFQFTIHKLS